MGSCICDRGSGTGVGWALDLGSGRKPPGSSGEMLSVVGTAATFTRFPPVVARGVAEVVGVSLPVGGGSKVATGEEQAATVDSSRATSQGPAHRKTRLGRAGDPG